MQTRTLSIREYCELAGFNSRTGYVQTNLKAGNLLVGMVEAKKVGNQWNVTVLETWAKGKEAGNVG